MELGYGTLARFQGRGYATESVSVLTAWALPQPEVSVVVADALPENAASVRVLEKSVAPPHIPLPVPLSFHFPVAIIFTKLLYFLDNLPSDLYNDCDETDFRSFS